jgi:hypothetical protein
MKPELVQLAAWIDWDRVDREVAPLYSDNGRAGIETRFVIGLLTGGDQQIVLTNRLRSSASSGQS